MPNEAATKLHGSDKSYTIQAEQLQRKNLRGINIVLVGGIKRFREDKEKSWRFGLINLSLVYNQKGNRTIYAMFILRQGQESLICSYICSNTMEPTSI